MMKKPAKKQAVKKPDERPYGVIHVEFYYNQPDVCDCTGSEGFAVAVEAQMYELRRVLENISNPVVKAKKRKDICSRSI